VLAVAVFITRRLMSLRAARAGGADRAPADA
jgi:hypothetical protein